MKTPLLEYIEQKKAEKLRSKEEKREERRRKEFERKKAKEEEKRKKKEVKEHKEMKKKDDQKEDISGVKVKQCGAYFPFTLIFSSLVSSLTLVPTAAGPATRTG